jgi:Flp pilus assembly pilin Flp
MAKFVRRFWNYEDGMAAVEYALLLAVVAAATAVGMSSLGSAVGAAVTATCISLGAC